MIKPNLCYMPCKQCGERMSGIMSYGAREVCEPCGGTAKFDSKEYLDEMLDEKGENV